MDWLDFLQWPAMAVTVGAAWLVASRSAGLRKWGFYVYFVSNLLWSAWGWYTGAWALITLQVALFLMNVRGASKNQDGDAPDGATART